MSNFSLLLLLLVVSCSAPKENPNTVGKVVRYEPVSSSLEETEKIAAICRGLASKEELLTILISTGASYEFSYAQKGCNDQALPVHKIVNASIQLSNDSNFVFKTKDNADFGFTDVETPTKGVMAKLCENLGQLTNPMQTSTSGAMWFSTLTDKEKCETDEKGLCIHIQRGTVVKGVEYKIHTNEWIKFKMENTNRGFFTERTLITSTGCFDDKTLERHAELK